MAAKDLRTVFIRGVSFDADEKALEQLFSDVGPVKQCFLVRVKGQPRHRGFGFVQYALPEDAERAVTDCNGKTLMGRKLQVELADKRAPLEERKKKRKLGQDGAADADEHAADDAGDKGPAAKGQSDKPATAAPRKTAVGKAQSEADGLTPDAGATPTAAATAAAAAPPRKRQRADGAADGAPAAEKHKLLRAVAIGNLTPAVLAQAVALARKAGPVEEVMNPAPADVVQQAKLEADGCSGSVVIVVYKTVKDAMHAVTQLHNKTLELRSNQPQQQQQQKGRKGKKQRGKGRGGDEEEDEEGAAEAAANGAGGDAASGAPQCITMWAREVKGEGAHVKQWRVILRNLPFKITEAALQKALQPVGFVWELKLPRGPDGRLKGFAFAAFTCRAHAEKAISLLNGKDLMGRMVVVDWAVSKTQYLQGSGAGAGAGAEGAADGAGKEATGSDDPDRPPSESDEPDAGTDEEGDDEKEEGADDDDDDDDEEEEIGLSSDEEDEVLDDEEEDEENEEDEDEDEEGGDDGEEEEEEEEAGGAEQVRPTRQAGWGGAGRGS